MQMHRTLGNVPYRLLFGQLPQVGISSLHGKKQWKLMDENGDHMEQMGWDGDNGIGNMIGMYIKHADQSFCDYFQSDRHGETCRCC